MMTLGVDSGMTKIGYGVVSEDGKLQDFGLWSPQSEMKGFNNQVIDKVRKLHPEVMEKIKQHGITHIALELVPVKAMAQRDKIIAVQNMFRCIAIEHGLFYRETAAVTVKKKATGDGRASKSKMKEFVFSTFPEMPEVDNLPADVYDAILVASVAVKETASSWWNPLGERNV